MRPFPVRVAVLALLLVAASPGCGSTSSRACGAAQDALDELTAIASSGNVSTQTPEWTAAVAHLQRMFQATKGSGNGALTGRTYQMMQQFLAVEKAPAGPSQKQAFVRAWRSLAPVADSCRLAGVPLRAPRGPDLEGTGTRALGRRLLQPSFGGMGDDVLAEPLVREARHFGRRQ